MNKDVETYAIILSKAADMLEQLNKKKNNPDVTEIVLQLRDMSATLLDKELNDTQKSANLIVRLYNYILSKLGA